MVSTELNDWLHDNNATDTGGPVANVHTMSQRVVAILPIYRVSELTTGDSYKIVPISSSSTSLSSSSSSSFFFYDITVLTNKQINRIIAHETYLINRVHDCHCRAYIV